MTSFPVNAKISQAVQQVQGWGVDSTPTIVVNGKYRVLARGGEDGYEKMLQVVDFLINEERKAKKAG
jgi:thiol:disulfide interchange protein DsbA